jgi:hypothetical protein
MKMRTSGQFCNTVLLVLGASLCLNAQETWLKHGNFIAKGDLPADFEASLQKMGGRLTSADKATVSVTGTLTDSSGSRSVKLTLQAPGYLQFQDSSGSRALAYDGSQWQNKNGKGGQDDTRIQESLLAHFPDSFFLQLANGGGIRRIGSRFRTDNGKTLEYTGPYWTLYAYSPNERKGLAAGQALQQSYFVALDEATWLIAEVRIVTKTSATSQQVTQTKFNKWFQQAGQWYPGEIVRLENGQQVLQFVVQQAATGAQLAKTTFKP